MATERLDTHQKALQINIDHTKYGTIAEIGAGQEVARWFFRVGGAAGTIAKTMSAYDMQVSDAIYGKGTRYVSRERVGSMLDHEYPLLIERLDEPRGERATFFTFADTLSARNYHGTNICHGWIGLRFQAEPRQEPSDVFLHVNMHDETNERQQLAIGILGVNLIHGAFYNQESPESFLSGLMDNLSLDRIDIDFVHLAGPLFKDVKEDETAISLLSLGLTTAVAFDEKRNAVEPMALMYKRPVVIERGSPGVLQSLDVGILEAATAQYNAEGHTCDRECASVFELSTAPTDPSLGGRVSEESREIEVLEMLRNSGDIKVPIVVTSLSKYFHLTSSFRRYTQEPIRFAAGMSRVMQIFTEEYYQRLDGGIVEAMGRLLAADVKLYVYPMTHESIRQRLEPSGFDLSAWLMPAGGEINLVNVKPISSLRHLYAYLFEVGAFLPMASANIR